jgi:ribosomal protein L11 methyltransferase
VPIRPLKKVFRGRVILIPGMNPDDLLYIYELAGTLDRPEDCFGQELLAHWREGTSTFLFFSGPAAAKMPAFLARHPGLSWVRTHDITYRDWQAGEDLEPLEIDRLRIIPLGRPVTTDDRSLTVIIDPGVVFGSGQHPTTRDSLRALLRVYAVEAPARVLDLGTGTGILALAALKLGAREVLAVDWNPACVANARRNAALNGFSERLRVTEGAAEKYIAEEADLLLANLHFAVVEELVRSPAFYEKPWVIVSGLLRSEARAIKDRLQQPGFTLVREWETDGTWFTLLGRNRGSHG